MDNEKLKINEKSIRTELKPYKDNPYKCLFEYIWNSFDAGATEIKLDFEIPKEGIWHIDNVRITDNGKGWDFDDDATTNNFMSSTKKPKANNTIPKGQYGRGRYTFIWISEKLFALSKGKKLTLQPNTEIKKEDSDFNQSGTQVSFEGIYRDFSNILLSDDLHKYLAMEFGWFLLENDNYQILINGVKLKVDNFIKDSKEYLCDSFPQTIRESLDNNFVAKIILWKERPSEYSKFYFLTELSIEILKQNTGLNKKSDDFWHSVYIKSSLFSSVDDVIDDDDDSQTALSFADKKAKRIKRQVITFLKEELVKLRKPYLIVQSDDLLKELKEEKLMPDLPEFGIYDEESYDDLIKTIYTISPSLFVGKNKREKKFICATFAGLLSTQDDVLIKKILEQLQELTEDEKKDLLEILKRTTLSNIIKTIKEIDHRLDVIDKLKFLISEHEKETLEVKHLQKILDENFWLFGEQFRLFSSTEGALKNVLIKYAKEILEIEDPELETAPNGEVDLFLTKTESTGTTTHKNIIVELKRASILLTEEKEYKQINDYRKKILEQTLCNGENQYWEFYLIGKNYDKGIKELIDSMRQYGEKEKGLAFYIENGRIKIYVRKWSDILEVEWGTKMKYLKEKLQIQAKQTRNSPQEITKDLIK